MLHSALTLVTAPQQEPLTVKDAKLYARIEESVEDDVIEALITVAREAVEDRGIAVLTQTWDLAFDRFPSVILIPRAPLVSVTSITYTDTAGTNQTLAASKYQVDTSSVPARILPAYGESWPSTRSIMNAVVVRFVAGYAGGATPDDDDVPARIRQYIREYVKAAYWDEPLPPHLDRLLDNQQVFV